MRCSNTIDQRLLHNLVRQIECRLLIVLSLLEKSTNKCDKFKLTAKQFTNHIFTILSPTYVVFISHSFYKVLTNSCILFFTTKKMPLSIKYVYKCLLTNIKTNLEK